MAQKQGSNLLLLLLLLRPQLVAPIFDQLPGIGFE